MRLISAGLLFLAAAAATPAGASPSLRDIALTPAEAALVDRGEVLLREVPGGSGAVECYEAVGTFDSAAARVYEVLTAFEDYHEFMPNVSSIEVLERTPGSALTNWALTLPLGKVKKYRLRLRYAIDDAGASIEWNMVDWPGLPADERIEDTSGHWILRAAGESSTVALYRLCTDPGPVPFGLGWIVDTYSKSGIPKTILSTRSRLEDRGR